MSVESSYVYMFNGKMPLYINFTVGLQQKNLTSEFTYQYLLHININYKDFIQMLCIYYIFFYFNDIKK